jgi:arsenite methyltransferase
MIGEERQDPMKDHEDVRKGVAAAYTRAVQAPSKGCCCQKSAVAQLAGYRPEELAGLPADAVVNSFGCGNPVAFAEVEAGEVVLDLGSGAGVDLLMAADKVGPAGKVIGVDMTDEMIERARENIRASGRGNIEVRKGIIEKLPVEDASVDWVISNCVINLSPEKDRVFAEIARVLKPGGRMSVSDIVVRDLPDWVRRNTDLYNACVAGAVSEEEYAAGLKRAGLQDVEVRERLVYDPAQIEQIAQKAVQGGAESLSCCGGQSADDLVAQAAESVAGKIWSARFYAKKPG